MTQNMGTDIQEKDKLNIFSDIKMKESVKLDGVAVKTKIIEIKNHDYKLKVDKLETKVISKTSLDDESVNQPSLKSLN